MDTATIGVAQKEDEEQSVDEGTFFTVWSFFGSVAKFDFWGKIQKLGIRNSMTYRLPKSRKSNFATEPEKLR